MAESFLDTGIPTAVLESTVRICRVVSHDTGATAGGSESQNYWTIYLVHKNSSTELSMADDERPEIEPPRGRLKITSLPYTTSSSAVRSWDFPAAQNITVYQVLQLITHWHRERYNMGDAGKGCRFWVETVINDLRECEIIDRPGFGVEYITEPAWDEVMQKYVEIGDIIDFSYTRDSPPSELPMQVGGFLD